MGVSDCDLRLRSSTITAMGELTIQGQLRTGAAAGYLSIANELAKRIRDGELPVGTRIPSERALATEFGVSRVTTRQATEVLHHQGLVTRIHGSGTFVAPPRLALTGSRLTRFTEQLKLQGVEPATRVVESAVMDASPEIVRQLDGVDSRRVLAVTRVLFGDGEALGIDRCFHPLSRFPGMEDLDLAGEHDDIVAERYATHPWRAQMTLAPTLPSAADVDLLGIPQTEPVLSIDWVGWDQRGRAWGCGRQVFHSYAANFVVIATAEDHS
jgi:GntR family transcriptional regulator